MMVVNMMAKVRSVVAFVAADGDVDDGSDTDVDGKEDDMCGQSEKLEDNR